MPALELPPGLAEADSIGIIYDETDGLNSYPEYGLLRGLFGNLALAADWDAAPESSPSRP